MRRRLRKSFTEASDAPQSVDLSHDGPGRRSGRIYLSLTVVCAILCIGSILFTINAFTDTQPGGTAGVVEILVSGEGNETVGLQTIYDAGKTEYDLYFPRVRASMKWALVLFGSAVLSNVDRDPQETSRSSQYRMGTCSSGVGSNPGSPQVVKCQVFYGTLTPFNSQPADIRRDFSNCGPTSNLYQSPAGPNGVLADVIVSGTSGAVVSESMLTKVITLPLLLQPPALIEDGIYPVGSIQDLAIGEITAAVGCDLLTVPNGYEISDIIPAPDFQDSRGLYWTASGSSGSPSVAVKRTWAGAAANVGVIAAGIFFTLTAVFLPLWLQTRRVGKRSSKAK